VAGHIFQARPVWIYTQSNITSIIRKCFPCKPGFLSTGKREGRGGGWKIFSKGFNFFERFALSMKDITVYYLQYSILIIIHCYNPMTISPRGFKIVYAKLI
jgi:hypothetical protein